MQKLGIFFFLGIGDWLLLTPAIEVIKRQFPATKIFLVTENRNLQPILKGDKSITGYSFLPDYSVFFRNFKEDDFILVPNYTYLRPWDECQRHLINFYGRILGLKTEVGLPKINLPKKDDDFGRDFARSFKGRIIVLYPFSSVLANRWDKKKWEALIKATRGYIFVQLGSKGSPSLKGALNLCGRTSLLQAFALVKYARLLVGVDGLFNHVAQAFGVPKVILWGPHSPRFFGYTDKTINIFKKISCSPCHPVNTQTLPVRCQERLAQGLSCRCMEKISVDEAQEAIKKLIIGFSSEKKEDVPLVLGGANLCRSCFLRQRCQPDYFKVRLRDLRLLRWLD